MGAKAMMISLLAAGVLAMGTAGIAADEAKADGGTADVLQLVRKFAHLERDAYPISGAFLYETSQDREERKKLNAQLHLPDDLNDRCSERLEWAKQGEMIRIGHTATGADGKVMTGLREPYIRVWDGHRGITLYPVTHKATLDLKREDAIGVGNDPRNFSVGGATCTPTLGVTTDGKWTLHRDQLDGRELLVLTQEMEGDLRREYWLDPAEGLLPRRIYRRGQVTSSLWIESITTVTAHVRTPNGGWFVTKATTEFPSLKKVSTFSAERVSFEPLPDSTFELKIPDNTLVYERATGLRFVAGGPQAVSNQVPR